MIRNQNLTWSNLGGKCVASVTPCNKLPAFSAVTLSGPICPLISGCPLQPPLTCPSGVAAPASPVAS